MDACAGQDFRRPGGGEQDERAPAPLSALTVGLKCGGSDGFSGISANPTLGYISDLLVSVGGKVTAQRVS